ncbi:succinate dehydrogenase [ubiquinone] cytochrome b subunit, mitochondrial [[Candida] jaroonii]|uniref:Succinate dehydrogenase [ubiquinone] cytochrome b subunit, mitochondrial n=1 Tax=[Candida] jaroonii TaxID=467808 RepID=A0ACA9Y4X0_9ASCO|nr:succinate dehydrogenase [ubiquinone] cytochrome b subunit, mitochondrial [[Candida] jaroonii]
MISRIGIRNLRTQQLNSFKTVRFNAIRTISTVESTQEDANQILVNQRKNRPTSPHLNIYQPQLTWVLSGLHRVTGVVMAFGFYGLTCTYAATSLLGIPLDSASIISAFAGLPLLAKVGVKASMAFPFVFHGFNGLRHIVWDFGSKLTIPGVYQTGYIVLGLTGLVGSYLTFF